MKKLVLLLALFLMASFSGCSNDEDLTDTITVGTWRVSYFIESGDKHTSSFNGYVFTFLTNGTVTVARPNLPLASGTWNEHDDNTRFDLDFGTSGLLEKLNEDWVVDRIENDEIFLHELGAPLNLFELARL